MPIIQVIILGIVQGLTEFLPVSSSGHLILAEQWLQADSSLAFDLALHLGTLLALLVYFRRELAGLAAGVFKPSQNRLSWLIIIATIPAVIAGILLQDQAETVFRSSELVAFNLVWVALLMLAVERLARKRFKLEQIGWRQSLAVGAAQALALIPGVSRSGITISAGLAKGMNYEAATKFSFLLSAPITAGAIIKVLASDGTMTQLGSQGGLVLAGVASAAVSGYLAISFMLKFLARFGLRPFAYYRIALGLVVLLAL